MSNLDVPKFISFINVHTCIHLHNWSISIQYTSHVKGLYEILRVCKYNCITKMSKFLPTSIGRQFNWCRKPAHQEKPTNLMTRKPVIYLKEPIEFRVKYTCHIKRIQTNIEVAASLSAQLA